MPSGKDALRERPTRLPARPATPTALQLSLAEDQQQLLASLIEFALQRYEDNRFPLIEGYIAPLRELETTVGTASRTRILTTDRR